MTGAAAGPDMDGARYRKRLPTDVVAVYPSAALRPIPSFTVGVPRGWEIDEAPDALGVLRVPEPVDGFWVNLILTADRVDHRVKLAHAATVTLERLQAQSPDLKVVQDRVADFGGRTIAIRVIELTAPSSGRELTQVQGITVADRAEGAKTRDLFQLTGTCPREHTDRYGPVFVEVIASFRVV